MKIVNRKISELKGAEYNPRELTEKQHQDLKNSLQEFGLQEPLIINKNLERLDIIISGHQRLKVWQELGNTEIPTIEVDLELNREKELNVRMNKNTGQFDFALLYENFTPEELMEWGFEEWEIESEDVNIKDFFEENEPKKEEPKNKIVLEYNEEDYQLINEKFNSLDGSKEDIIWNLLELEREQ